MGRLGARGSSHYHWLEPPFFTCAYRSVVNHNSNEDHPRVCGKDPNYGGNLDLDKGSPPRMRERRAKREKIADSTRITPAYAGKTLFSGASGA